MVCRHKEEAMRLTPAQALGFSICCSAVLARKTRPLRPGLRSQSSEASEPQWYHNAPHCTLKKRPRSGKKRPRSGSQSTTRERRLAEVSLHERRGRGALASIGDRGAFHG